MLTRALATLLALALSAAAQPDSIQSRIEREAEAFKTRQQALKAEFIGKFATAMNAVRSSKALNAQTKSARLDAIRADRDRFIKEGSLPDTDDMLPHLWQYQYDLHRARSGWSKAYQAAMDVAVRARDDAGLKKLADEKAKADAAAAGREAFEADTNWKGSHHAGSTGSAEVTLAVTYLAGNTFKGTLRQSRTHSGLMAVEGTLDGALIEFRTTEVLGGRPRAMAYKGFLLGERILLAAGGIAPDGAPAGGVMVLRK